ncbi:MAG: ADP-ribose-binding protein [bacterium]
MYFEKRINKTRLILKVGDLTEEDVDAIVNAANPSLLGGGGVDGAIHRKGGHKILEECKKIGHCNPGEAVITTGGNLKARFVIHTVGPIYRDGRHGEAEVLKNAYINSLKVAVKHKLRTVAFPSISTGAYGYPVKDAAKVAIDAVVSFLKSEDSLREVRFVLFREDIFIAYKDCLEVK